MLAYVLAGAVYLIWPLPYAILLVVAALARTARLLALLAAGMFVLLALALIFVPPSVDGQVIALYLLAVPLLLLSALVFGVKLFLFWRAEQRARQDVSSAP